MPSTKREGLPSFWTTRIAKILVGEQPCHLEAWLGGHYNLGKRVRDDNGSLVKWKANHTEMLTDAVQAFRETGWKCDVERFFKVTGQTAILSGKADMIATKTDLRPLIVDVKSGEPRDSDPAQVLIEMVMIPLAWNKHIMFDGLVLYANHRVALTQKDADAMRPKIFNLLKRLALASRPTASPSEGACRFCEVSESDCPDRWAGTTAELARTDLF